MADRRLWKSKTKRQPKERLAEPVPEPIPPEDKERSTMAPVPEPEPESDGKLIQMCDKATQTIISGDILQSPITIIRPLGVSGLDPVGNHISVDNYGYPTSQHQNQQLIKYNPFYPNASDGKPAAAQQTHNQIYDVPFHPNASNNERAFAHRAHNQLDNNNFGNRITIDNYGYPTSQHQYQHQNQHPVNYNPFYPNASDGKHAAAQQTHNQIYNVGNRIIIDNYGYPTSQHQYQHQNQQPVNYNPFYPNASDGKHAAAQQTHNQIFNVPFHPNASDNARAAAQRAHNQLDNNNFGNRITIDNYGYPTSQHQYQHQNQHPVNYNPFYPNASNGKPATAQQTHNQIYNGEHYNMNVDNYGYPASQHQYQHRNQQIVIDSIGHPNSYVSSFRSGSENKYPLNNSTVSSSSMLYYENRETKPYSTFCYQVPPSHQNVPYYTPYYRDIPYYPYPQYNFSPTSYTNIHEFGSQPIFGDQIPSTPYTLPLTKPFPVPYPALLSAPYTVPQSVPNNLPHVAQITDCCTAPHTVTHISTLTLPCTRSTTSDSQSTIVTQDQVPKTDTFPYNYRNPNTLFAHTPIFYTSPRNFQSQMLEDLNKECIPIKDPLPNPLPENLQYKLWPNDLYPQIWKKVARKEKSPSVPEPGTSSEIISSTWSTIVQTRGSRAERSFGSFPRRAMCPVYSTPQTSSSNPTATSSILRVPVRWPPPASIRAPPSVHARALPGVRVQPFTPHYGRRVFTNV